MAAMELQRQWDIEDRDEMRAYSRDVYKHLVTDAEAAGFNPLTALRNGGGANYNAAAGMAPLSRKAPVRQAVGGSPIGDAASQFGRDFLANFDPFADTKREQEYRLIESQISSLNAGALSSNRVARGVSRSYGAPDYERRPSGKAAALRGNAPGEGTLVGGDDPTVSSLGLNNKRYGWFHAPWFPDAETIETIYGDNEIFSTIGGGFKAIADGLYSTYRNGYSLTEDSNAAILSLPSKKREKVVKQYNDNFDRMFGAEYKRRLKNASW
nr:MAG: hypothetical protein [Microvirus sp.]